MGNCSKWLCSNNFCSIDCLFCTVDFLFSSCRPIKMWQLSLVQASDHQILAVNGRKMPLRATAWSSLAPWWNSAASAAVGIDVSQILMTSPNYLDNSGTFSLWKLISYTNCCTVEAPVGHELVLPHLFGQMAQPWLYLVILPLLMQNTQGVYISPAKNSNL